MRELIIHSCGHEQEHVLPPSVRARARELKRLKEQLCRRCYLRRREQEEYEAAELNLQEGLPPLLVHGHPFDPQRPAQVQEWRQAEAVRRQLLGLLRRHQVTLSAHHPHLAESLALAESINSAEWWLAHARTAPDHLVELLADECRYRRKIAQVQPRLIAALQALPLPVIHQGSAKQCRYAAIIRYNALRELLLRQCLLEDSLLKAGGWSGPFAALVKDVEHALAELEALKRKILLIDHAVEWIEMKNLAGEYSLAQLARRLGLSEKAAATFAKLETTHRFLLCL